MAIADVIRYVACCSAHAADNQIIACRLKWHDSFVCQPMQAWLSLKCIDCQLGWKLTCVTHASQEGELSPETTSLGLVGSDLNFTILEGDSLQPHIQSFKEAEGIGAPSFCRFLPRPTALASARLVLWSVFGMRCKTHSRAQAEHITHAHKSQADPWHREMILCRRPTMIVCSKRDECCLCLMIGLFQLDSRFLLLACGS